MKRLLFLLLFIPSISVAQDSLLRVMFYNLYRYPTHSPANREFLLKEIVNEAQLDLLMTCELVSRDGFERILNTSFLDVPDSFSAADFVYSATAVGDPLQQAIYYNTRKLTLLKQRELATTIRDINHYTFKLNLEEPQTDVLFLEVFVSHLKAGTSNSDKALRASMVDTFKKYLHEIPSHHHVLFAGDFNFYNDQEPAYIKLMDTGHAIIMVDPIDAPGNWHDNPDFKEIHTQATRVSTSGFGIGGASGGLDDRFDFILMSESLKENALLRYQKDSYKAFGNNGNCFDSDINNDTCNGIYSQYLRNILFQMSDHLPVVMNLISTQSFQPSERLSLNELNRGSEHFFTFPMGNRASDILTVIFEKNADHQEPILVYDNLGRVVGRHRIHPHAKDIKLNVSRLTAGVYYLKYQNKVAKFLKY